MNYDKNKYNKMALKIKNLGDSDSSPGNYSYIENQYSSHQKLCFEKD
jgi:hypothetical protein